MATHGAFVLPAGVKLTLDGDALSVENPGDIVIEGLPAQRLGTLLSTEGDVVLAPPRQVTLGEIRAPSGTVTIKGKVSVDSIAARDVEFVGGSLKASVVRAEGKAVLSGARLEADVVVASTVEISPDMTGRATAIQADHELGAHKLKGGFDLAEFVSLMPGGADLLRSHGIEVPEGGDDDADADSDDEDEDEDEEEGPSAPRRATASEEKVTSSGGVPVEVKAQVKEALAKIRAAYEDDAPPPIALLGQLVEAGELPALRMQINTIWSDLLKHHQQTGQYISNTVTHMFQTIQLQLRKVGN